MRIIFMGTPDFAVPTLNALVEAGHDIAAVYSQPPSRSGRGKKERPSPVQARAEALDIEVRHPRSLKGGDEQAAFAALKADVAVVAAYGLLLPQPILNAPKHGCLNVHGSLLPRWRGAAPIHRAIQAGDAQTGITIMQMEAGLDTGPMLMKAATPIADKTTGELHDELAELGAGLMIETLAAWPTLEPQVQDDTLATYAPKIGKEEARLDFAKPADVLEREVRAFSPFPGSWMMVDGERLKWHRAEVVDSTGDAGRILDKQLTIACGDMALRPVTVQKAGKPAMAIEDYLRGNPIVAGSRAG
ncbi:methionyl-tRNA formyltransferase [Aurantiacibacter gangjinensis]|uniref:Methionyl-tRNA formyltransferase n=1 Tax=Aurantiacibacter gangjinensis TaxID=502682 RepID=A0A0G9MRC0_9SPHN|nr:methionyl-tRNA formyltransferase [Aurantiacibacter gangjinensis]APE29211.1 Methionyl-tRNA formyltransferase [Aurantiacibacter gangjinensis]KLE33272.1 methionyl-tRNA formyltransferase [Aurantiacibacter gangjinensis]